MQLRNKQLNAVNDWYSDCQGVRLITKSVSDSGIGPSLYVLFISTSLTRSLKQFLRYRVANKLVDKSVCRAREPISSFVMIGMVNKCALRVKTRKGLCEGKKLTFILILSSFEAAFPNSSWMN